LRGLYRGAGSLPWALSFTFSCQRTIAHPFIRNLGFITPADVRRISFEQAVRLEKIHEETYRDFGFELVPVEPRSLAERVSIIKAAIR
jgi:predicted ATPase